MSEACPSASTTQNLPYLRKIEVWSPKVCPPTKHYQSALFEIEVEEAQLCIYTQPSGLKFLVSLYQESNPAS